jgi:hypothetical protein
VLITGLIAVAIIYIGFPTESIWGGRDHGVYANHGTYISRHGRLDVPYPYSKSSESLFKEAILDSLRALPDSLKFFFPGFYLTSQTITVQFSHLFPVWLAQAFSTFGHYGLFRLNALFALLSSGIFYGLCRSFTPKPYAVIATLFLLLNPSQIWMSRITLTEIFTQFSILSGFLVLALAIKNSNRILARWAGLFFGFSALIRIDSLLLAPLLFISHLAQKTVDLPSEVKTSSIWYPFYQMALPLFSLAVCYYLFFSTPYFLYLKFSLMITGFLTLAALVLLIVITPNRSKYFRKLLTSKIFLALICFIIISLAIYAYWIRPTIEPFSVINWPGHVLHGTRNYYENSLINLTKYLSPFVVWGGIFGFLCMLWLIFQKKLNIELMPLLLIYGGITAAYLWKPSITPDHFWAIRRFVPLIIPGFIFFATFGICWILNRLRKKWYIAISIFILIYITAFSIRSDALIIFFAENKGSFAQLQQMADKLLDNEIIIAHGPSAHVWATPLAIAFDKKIVPLDLTIINGISTFDKWIDKNIKEGRPAYLLCEDNLKFPRFKTNKKNFELSYFFVGPTVNPLPTRIMEDKKNIKFYKITGITKSANYMDIPMGSETIYGVRESGFHGTEWSGSNPVRWTNGNAELVVPINIEQSPKALEVKLASTGPKGTMFQILINGRRLFNGHLPPGSWNKTFKLSEDLFGNQAIAERQLILNLVSDTFIPKEIIKSSEDNRSLGVSVQSIRLMEKELKLSGKALLDKSYRSHLELTEKGNNYSISSKQSVSLNITVRNMSEEPWPTIMDLPDFKGSVRIGIVWFKIGQMEKRLSEHRKEIIPSLFPGEESEIEIELRPSDYYGKPLPPGDYEVWIGLVQEHITWFYEKGDHIIKLYVKVTND